MCGCCEGTATWLPILACPPAPVLGARPLTWWTESMEAVAWMTLINTGVTDYSNISFFSMMYDI